MRVQIISPDNKTNNNLKIKKNNNSYVNFKRNWSEHVSWGANYINKKGSTNFKLFSFPDAKKVFVEVAKKVAVGAEDIKNRFVQLSAMVGASYTVNQITSKDSDSQVYPMENKGNGIYEAKNIKSAPGDKYRYIIVDKDNNINIVKDPYAKKQENIHGWSTIYNQNAYKWKNTDWIEGKDSRRIVRKPNEKYRGLEKLNIEEINIPTLSKKGTFDAAKKRIDIIADRGIATAIEILPVENTYSLQWGYDGVDKFAVNEKMGGPDKLKEFVDYAHGKGLNVIMDMVPNHMGPEGNYLSKTGPYKKGPSRFGDSLNYEGKDNKYVRDWMTNAALWWANEFKVDGIRLDMTKLCGSDYLLKQIATELNEHNPNVFIIAEDGRNNKESVTRYETRPTNHEKDLYFIDSQVDFIAQGYSQTTPVNVGFDSEWDFNFMETMKNAILNPGVSSLEGVDNKIKESQHRVKYVMSHDEIGNWDGTRLIPKILNKQLNLFNIADGHNDTSKGQKAAHLANKIAKQIFAEATNDDKTNSLIAGNFTDTQVKHTIKYALAKQKLMFGLAMTVPGPKLYFQGDDEADLSYFKFFREFSNEKLQREKNPQIKHDIIAQKGYDTLEEAARPDCIVGETKYGEYFKSTPQKMIAFNHDLANLVYNNDALLKGDIVATYKDYNHNVHSHLLKYGNKEVLVIKNFGDGFHKNNYEYFGFPQNSMWREIFNSDNEKYGGANFINEGRTDISNLNQKLSLAPNSFIILEKI